MEMLFVLAIVSVFLGKGKGVFGLVKVINQTGKVLDTIIINLFKTGKKLGKEINILRDLDYEKKKQQATTLIVSEPISIKSKAKKSSNVIYLNQFSKAK